MMGQVQPHATPIHADLQPTLECDVVRLRPLAPTDWTEMFAAAADPLIWQQHPAADRWQEPVFRAFFEQALLLQSAFAIIEPATNAIIGSTRYHGLDPERSEIEIGWTFLIRRCWGGRINHAMKRLMIEHAFGFVNTVVLLIDATNARSLAAAKKMGATPVGLVQTHDRAIGPVMRTRWEFHRNDWAAIAQRLAHPQP